MGINFYTQTTTNPVENNRETDKNIQTMQQQMPREERQHLNDLKRQAEFLKQSAEYHNRDLRVYAKIVCKIDRLEREIQQIEQKYSGNTKPSLDVIL